MNHIGSKSESAENLVWHRETESLRLDFPIALIMSVGLPNSPKYSKKDFSLKNLHS